MSPSHPQQKLVKKNTRVTGKIILAHFWGQLGGKKEWYSYKSKIVRVDELSKLTNNGVVLFWKKELPNLALSVYLSVL